MLSVVPWLLSLQSPSSDVDVLLRRVAIERGRYGEVLHPTNEAFKPDYQLAGPCMMTIFPVGEWQRRYSYKPIGGTLASTWKQSGHIRETWYVKLTGRSDGPLVSGIGTLDAFLGRSHDNVKSGPHDDLVLRALDKKQAYAAYVYRIMAERMMYFFVDPSGNITEDRDAPYDIHGSQPYPMTPEERKYLDEDAFLGICPASDKLAIYRMLSDRAFRVSVSQSSGIARFFVRRLTLQRAMRIVGGRLTRFLPPARPDLLRVSVTSMEHTAHGGRCGPSPDYSLRISARNNARSTSKLPDAG